MPTVQHSLPLSFSTPVPVEPDLGYLLVQLDGRCLHKATQGVERYGFKQGGAGVEHMHVCTVKQLEPSIVACFAAKPK